MSFLREFVKITNDFYFGMLYNETKMQKYLFSAWVVERVLQKMGEIWCAAKSEIHVLCDFTFGRRWEP